MNFKYFKAYFKKRTSSTTLKLTLYPEKGPKIIKLSKWIDVRANDLRFIRSKAKQFSFVFQVSQSKKDQGIQIRQTVEKRLKKRNFI